MISIDEFFDQLIDSYLHEANCGMCNDENIIQYYSTLSIEEAIINATNRGRFLVNGMEQFDSHYDYFAPSKLAESKDILLRLMPNFVACKGKSFMDVYEIVRNSHKLIVDGLSDLYFYDTAFRIAASSELGLFPEDVFLQRGAKYGAQLMSIIIDLPEDKPFLAKNKFDRASAAFKKLTAYQTESFLCVKKMEIKEYFGGLVK